MKVKICGITNADDASAAVEAGADALGFIFDRTSPRYVSPETAGSIVATLPPFVTSVGVFVNCPRTEVFRIARVAGIRAIQFHGDETPQDLEGYPLPVYKAFTVHAAFDVSILQPYPRSMFLLDTFVNGFRGGTGKTFDWKVAVEASRYGRIMLSGGLNPDNIAEAVRTVRPYAVDVGSGVESSPGKKDSTKLKELFAALRTTQEYAC